MSTTTRRCALRATPARLALAAILMGLVLSTQPTRAPADVRPSGSVAVAEAAESPDSVGRKIYFPIMRKAPPRTVSPCAPVAGESYGDLDVDGPATDRPAAQHADLNLGLRSYQQTTAQRGLVDYGGDTDSRAPQLPGLFGDNRTARFDRVYRVYDWDWGRSVRGSLITSPEVTLAGLATTPGEVIRVPDSGYGIGSGYEVLVLYAGAADSRITLKYTREDNVVRGYTLHLENVCIEPGLLSLYQSWNSRGRSRLPALRAGQAVGRVRSSEVGVAIRDNGTFLDPRSRKDWWQGRSVTEY